MATEKRLIDANALRKQFDDIPPFIGLTGGCVQQYIDRAPTVDAVEVVHGRWLGGYQQNGEHWRYELPYCSICGHRNDGITNYCPNCGAKMDGDGNG
jgi:hypothetical protein